MRNVVDLFPYPGQVCSDFDLFWQAYPKKQRIGPAKRQWGWAILQASPQQLIEGAQRYAAYCKAEAIEERFIQMAVNWLMDERWNDIYGTAGPAPVSEEDRLRELHRRWYTGRDNAFKQDWRANRISEADKAALRRLGLID